MKFYNYLIFGIFWTLLSILLYLFLFTSFGYFSYNNNLAYKKNLLIQNENLENENKLLQEKILQLDKNLKEDSEQINVILFKFQHQTVDQITSNNDNKISKNDLIFDNDKKYFYLYIFLVVSGYIYLFLSLFKQK